MVRSQVKHQLQIALWNQIYIKGHGTISEQVRINVRIQSQDQIWIQVWEHVENQVWEELPWDI